MHWIFFLKELVINQAKLDKTGIRFPDENLNNVSHSSEKKSTFLELPKQASKAIKGIYYVIVRGVFRE